MEKKCENCSNYENCTHSRFKDFYKTCIDYKCDTRYIYSKLDLSKKKQVIKKCGENNMNEIEKKEIDETAKDVAKRTICCYKGWEGLPKDVKDRCLRDAEYFINAGYHKTVWHKVSEGDLPTDEKDVYVYLGDNDYTRGYYNKSRKCFFNSEFDLQDRKLSVVAWTDLPTFLPTT